MSDRAAPTAFEYCPGQWLDVYEPAVPSRTLVLLWHGRGANERDVLAPLASSLVDGGLTVIVPDWNADLAHEGRDHLLASLRVAAARCEETSTDHAVLVGWSLGASAGLDLFLDPTVADGWIPQGFVGLAGGYRRSPFSVAASGASDASLVEAPTVLLHGTRDEIVPVAQSRAALSRLRARGVTVALHELDTDHAGIIGTRYDDATRRCAPSLEPARRDVLAAVSGEILAVANAVTGSPP